MADQAALKDLFEKYLRRECTRQEVEELVALLQDNHTEDLLTPRLHELWEQIKQEQKVYPIDWQQMYQRVHDNGHPPIAGKISTRRIVFRAAAAIAAVLMLSSGWYLWHRVSSEQKTNVSMATKNLHDIPPGGNKAVLTLVNGATIILDKAQNGAIATQGQSQVIKLDSGELAYQASASSKPGSIQYNTLATPRGGQYRLRLPDGTKVWLNAASSIRYPTAFPGNARDVEISGEVYFEVIDNPSKPFQVIAGGQIVHVLGTHFNINAYPDEPAIRTTLLEGSVKVSAGRQAMMLKPGQQSIIDSSDAIHVVNDADIASAVAWKDNIFRFNNESLGSIMREICRWYNVDVEYDNDSVKDLRFGGVITRFSNVSQVLKMLELTHEVHFKIENSKVLVMK